MHLKVSFEKLDCMEFINVVIAIDLAHHTLDDHFPLLENDSMCFACINWIGNNTCWMLRHCSFFKILRRTCFLVCSLFQIWSQQLTNHLSCEELFGAFPVDIQLVQWDDWKKIWDVAFQESFWHFWVAFEWWKNNYKPLCVNGVLLVQPS